MRCAIAGLALVAAMTGACAIPSEDALEADLILTVAAHEWRNDYATFPCAPEPVIEYYHDERGVTTGAFIGVVGECSETSIGVAWNLGTVPPVEYGRFTP